MLRTSCIVVLCWGCPDPSAPDCLPSKEVYLYVDADGDGFGGPEPLGFACAAQPGQAANTGDCDDADPMVNPGVVEQCDLVDNDCDGQVDEDFPIVPFFADGDGDGHGVQSERYDACTAPGEAWSRVAGDCNDLDPNVSPDAVEVCNGVDDDCDTLVDDLDPDLDPSTRSIWHPDADSDGFGDPSGASPRCDPPAPSFTLDASDCDDTRSDVFPGATEVCDRVDNDCDTLVDDDDGDLPLSELTLLHVDADADGFGHPTDTTLACFATPGIASDNDWDCDDTDPWATTIQHWYADADADGSGIGDPVITQCLNPGNGLAPARHGVDCDDDDAARSPITPEVCGDDIDQDCDTWDRPCFATCGEVRIDDPKASSGLYALDTGAEPHTLYCDMVTDGGGWMLVASTLGDPPRDEATATRFDDLDGLQPTSANRAIYDGLRDIVDLDSDIRFSCTLDASSTAMTVDLSFYDIHWYHEITTGDDVDSCFNESNGAGADPEPERRDNLTGVTLAALDPWDDGPLQGEDTCGDSADFVIDFDDGGGDSSLDGTDWGEDDGLALCGDIADDETAWFIWVR